MSARNNPFKYSHVVTGQSFCNRDEEQRTLQQCIKNSQNVLIYSHRRTGKSSLIKQVFENIRKQHLDIGMMYVDLYGTTSEKDFITRGFQQIGALESSMDKLFHIMKKSLQFLPAKIGLDPMTLLPTLTPEFHTVDKALPLQTLMDLLEKFSRDRKLVIVFDEFQEIASYTEADAFEKRLRSFIQLHERISYIFSGSQKHMLTAMFHSQNRAFYHQAATLTLKEIRKKDYIPWLKYQFAASLHPVPPEYLPAIVDQFEGQPMYIQFFCYFLWEKLRETPWNDGLLQELESLMINEKHLEYQMLWDNLTGNQKKTLKLLLTNDGKNLFTGDALQQAEIKTASIVTQCLKTLCEKQILVKNSRYIIQDVLLRKWLERNS